MQSQSFRTKIVLQYLVWIQNFTIICPANEQQNEKKTSMICQVIFSKRKKKKKKQIEFKIKVSISSLKVSKEKKKEKSNILCKLILSYGKNIHVLKRSRICVRLKLKFKNFKIVLQICAINFELFAWKLFHNLYGAW